MEFYIFGSQDSIDADLLVLVSELGTTDVNKKRVKELESELQQGFTKPVNVNLGVLNAEGYLDKVFKGTVDEVNNSVLQTYNLHTQKCPLKINQRVERDIQIKILRATRGALSFMSRSQHRKEVKLALLGDLKVRIDALDKIDFSIPIESNKYPLKDVLKSVAFQLGQTLCLMKGIEVYSKAELSKEFPELKEFLYREEKVDLNVLEKTKKEYVTQVRNYYPNITQWEEYL